MEAGQVRFVDRFVACVKMLNKQGRFGEMIECTSWGPFLLPSPRFPLDSYNSICWHLSESVWVV